jgi:hypothetical protein
MKIGGWMGTGTARCGEGESSKGDDGEIEGIPAQAHC